MSLNGNKPPENWRYNEARIRAFVNNANKNAHNRRQWLLQEIGSIPAYDLYQKMELQNWECVYCGDKITFDSCCLDHVDPLVNGGAHYLYNVFYACTTCNTGKGSRTLKQFCKKRDFDIDEIRQRMAEINQQLHNLFFSDNDHS